MICAEYDLLTLTHYQKLWIRMVLVESGNVQVLIGWYSHDVWS